MTAAYRTRKPSEINICNIAQIISNGNERRKHTYHYEGETGHGYYLVNGQKVSSNEFDKMFPLIGEPIRLKGNNPDTTKV